MQARGHEGGGRLHNRLIDDLGRGIVEGRVEAGQLLVPHEIGDRHGVSSAVVREALRVLGAMGLLTAKRKAGTRVTAESEWDYLDPQIIAWRLANPGDADQLRELLELRQAIEPMAVRLVTADPNPELVTALASAAEEMAGAMACNDVHRFTAADVTFHAAIFEHCGNRMLGRLSSVITTSLQVREWRRLPFVEHTRHGLDMHCRLVTEIASGDNSAEVTIRQIVNEFDFEQAVAVLAPERAAAVQLAVDSGRDREAESARAPHDG